MASPTLETFCCAYNVVDHNHSRLEYQSTVYNSVCITSSVISILGSIYQWLPRKETERAKSQREVLFTIRQRRWVFWLSVADALACFGIFIRSVLWLNGYLPLSDSTTEDNPDFKLIFCAISSGWVQYFYISTYFWTFLYALDAYYFMKGKDSKPWLFHVLGWIVPAGLCGGGLISLYYPSLLRCEHSLMRLLPNFLATYIPIIVVMIVNPVLYYYAASSVQKFIAKKRGQYTNIERKISEKVRDKFLKVMMVFYLCWVPNILNGLLLLSNKYSTSIPTGVFKIVWMIMAVVNPLQAFLNTLVYQGLNGCDFKRPRLSRMTVNSEQCDHLTSSTEISPLMSYRH